MLDKIPGWAQALAAMCSLSIAVGAATYNITSSLFMAQVESRLMEYGKNNEKFLNEKFDKLGIQYTNGLGDIENTVILLNSKVATIESQLIRLQIQQEQDVEIRKLVKATNETLSGLKSDIKLLQDKTTKISDISKQLDNVSKQVAVITEKIKEK